MKDKMEDKQKANSIWFDLISRRYLLAITLNLELEESVFTNDVMVVAAVVPAPPPPHKNANTAPLNSLSNEHGLVETPPVPAQTCPSAAPPAFSASAWTSVTFVIQDLGPRRDPGWDYRPDCLRPWSGVCPLQPDLQNLRIFVF